MPAQRIFRLSSPSPASRRFVSGIAVELSEAKPTSWVTVTRTGQFYDPRYGKFEISRDMLLAMVRNFEARTYGQDIFLDVAHEPDNGAAAKVLRLTVEGDRLRAQVEWTEYGRDAVKKRGFQYLSAEFSENFCDNETGQTHGPVLLGAGLTVRPVIKRLDPVTLSCDSGSDIPTYFHRELQTSLIEEAHMNKQESIKRLRQRLALHKLSEAAINTLVEAATVALAENADQAQCDAVCNQIEDTAKKLAEASAGSITLSVTSGSGLSADDVRRVLAEERKHAEEAARKLAEGREAAAKAYTDAMAAAKGIDDDTRKQLAEQANELLQTGMNADQAKKLAEQHIALGNTMMVAKQLSEQGFGVRGQVQVQVLDEGTRKLSGIYRDHLKKTQAAFDGSLRLSENKNPFIASVLSEFDRLHGHRIDQEVRLLSGGQVGMADTSLPVGFQRQVIEEALSDLNVLQLVQTLTDFGATETTQIPYEQRDTSAVLNDGIVYEGQPIARAGIGQLMDTAYLTPMKVAMLISNEVMHLTRASQINWDAMARNLASNARLMRELVARRIYNALQRAADSYLSVAVSAENIASQLAGAKSTIKTAQFPIVSPYQVRNMKGDAIGSEQNPITVVLNGATLQAYDGSGAQSAGTYYRVVNYNLGYVQFVNQAGSPVTPTASSTTTISYSYATNIIKVDSDVPNGTDPEKHLNLLVQAVGRAKARLSQERFVRPDYVLTNSLLMDTASNAEQFAAERQRAGTSTTASGDLGTLKALPVFDTNAPGTHLGEERLLIGQRGALGYTISKPFETVQPFEAVNSQGVPIGKKQTYGEEYNSVHVPAPVKNRHMSVIFYSAAARTAA